MYSNLYYILHVFFDACPTEALQLGRGLQRLASVGPIRWSACGASVGSVMEEKNKNIQQI